MQRIKKWHVKHRATHPVECQAWDAILTLWIMGWVGWLPACILGQMWGIPLCAAAIAAPSLYVAWRIKAHRDGRLRCDWIHVRA